MPFKLLSDNVLSITSLKRVILSAAMLMPAVGLVPSASALSCMRADLAQTMESAKASDDLYYILVGSFDYTPLPRPPKTNNPNAPMNGIGAHTVQAWFNGRILSNNPRGDQSITHMPVDIAVSCAGPWCGSAPAVGQEVIAFAKARAGEPMLLSAGPCPDKVHRLDPAKPQIETLRACFDAPCSERPMRDRY